MMCAFRCSTGGPVLRGKHPRMPCDRSPNQLFAAARKAPRLSGAGLQGAHPSDFNACWRQVLAALRRIAMTPNDVSCFAAVWGSTVLQRERSRSHSEGCGRLALTCDWL